MPGLATISRASSRAGSARCRSASRRRDRLAGDRPLARGEDGQHRGRQGDRQARQPEEFYERLEPDAIAEHIVETSRDDIRDLVERTLQREHPGLWNDLPPRVREAVHARVQEQLPEVVRSVTDGIGADIDHLMDVKLMVIRQMEERPELANRIFLEIGKKELRFIINFGFWFGLLLGIPTAIVTELVFHDWWLLPICGVIIGYVTNLVAILMIFEPVEERQIGPFKLHGLFLRRQREVAGIYSKVIAEDVVNLSNIGRELLEGPQSDRTRKLIVNSLRPAIDQASGSARRAVRVAVGTDRYDTIRESVATEAVDYTMTPLEDPDFNERQSEAIDELITERMREMPSKDFSEMLRTVIREDEWLLYLHGAVLGFGAGLLHLADLRLRAGKLVPARVHDQPRTRPRSRASGHGCARSSWSGGEAHLLVELGEEVDERAPPSARCRDRPRGGARRTPQCAAPAAPPSAPAPGRPPPSDVGCRPGPRSSPPPRRFAPLPR